MAILPKPYISKSVFVNTPTQTPGTFSNGVSFTDIVREASVVHNITKTLTAADVLSLATSPFVLLPATSGVAYEPLAFSWKLNFNSVAYDVSGVTLLALYVGGVKYFSDNVLSTLSTGTTQSFSFTRNTVGAVGLSENDSVTIACDADPTLGDSTVTIELLYKINTFA